MALFSFLLVSEALVHQGHDELDALLHHKVFQSEKIDSNPYVFL